MNAIDLLPLPGIEKTPVPAPEAPPADYERFGRAVCDYLRRAHGDFSPLVEIALRCGVAREINAGRATVVIFPPPR